MTENLYPLPAVEQPPYKETLAPDDPRLNLNSYTAQAIGSLRVTAMKYLMDTALATPGYTVQKDAINALAAVLETVVLTAQSELSNRMSFQDGLNSRCRYVLFELMDSHMTPPILSTDLTAWQAWETQMVSRIKMVVGGIIEDYKAGPRPGSYQVLVGLAPATAPRAA